MSLSNKQSKSGKIHEYKNIKFAYTHFAENVCYNYNRVELLAVFVLDIFI